MIESIYPKVKSWKLETLANNKKLNNYYESIGYVLSKQRVDKKSQIVGNIYKKK